MLVNLHINIIYISNLMKFRLIKQSCLKKFVYNLNQLNLQGFFFLIRQTRFFLGCLLYLGLHDFCVCFHKKYTLRVLDF